MKYFVAFLLLFCFAFSEMYSQQSTADTFSFRFVEKTSAHPFFGLGDSIGYSVDGVEGGTIHMERGSVYSFVFLDMRADQAPTLATSGRGVGFDKYVGAYYGDDFSNLTIFYRLPFDTPDTMYYVGIDYQWAGGMIIVSDPPTGAVEESQASTTPTIVAGANVTPNPITSLGNLSFTLSTSTDLRVEVYDLLGRVVQPGTHYTALPGSVEIPISREGLRSGLYFYRLVRENGEILITGCFHVR